MHLKSKVHDKLDILALRKPLLTEVSYSQYVCVHILLIDKGFCETETSYLSCNILVKCIYNLSGDLITVYK